MENEQVDPTECELCGERFLPETHPHAYTGSDERGEFVVDREGLTYGRKESMWGSFPPIPVGTHVLVHASCGLERDLPLA